MEKATEAQTTESLDVHGLVRVVDELNARQRGPALPELDETKSAFRAWIREEDRRGNDFALCW